MDLFTSWRTWHSKSPPRGPRTGGWEHGNSPERLQQSGADSLLRQMSGRRYPRHPGHREGERSLFPSLERCKRLRWALLHSWEIFPQDRHRLLRRDPPALTPGATSGWGTTLPSRAAAGPSLTTSPWWWPTLWLVTGTDLWTWITRINFVHSLFWANFYSQFSFNIKNSVVRLTTQDQLWWFNYISNVQYQPIPNWCLIAA